MWEFPWYTRVQTRTSHMGTCGFWTVSKVHIYQCGTPPRSCDGHIPRACHKPRNLLQSPCTFLTMGVSHSEKCTTSKKMLGKYFSIPFCQKIFKKRCVIISLTSNSKSE
uniref:Uncharacterized protein n=1 Tax=Photinus pyralis TaxID=7054 RepID=A0A1Y1M5R2_PHOPY